MSEPSPGGFPDPPDPRASGARLDTASDRALARYRSGLRRPRAVYFGIVTVVVVALGVFAAVAWSRGEAAHVSLHTAADPAPTLQIGTPATSVNAAWRTSDHVAVHTPQYGGTVISWSAHTVRGRDARTGGVVWSYTRTDRTMCTAAQLNGVTIAVYRTKGNCDQLNALDSETGRRVWTRTLDEDGMPLNGTPSYQSTDSTLMLTTSSVIYAVDPVTGLDRWTYTRYGCRIERAVLGSAGALISQNCTRPDCSQLAKCGAGPQLVLRDAGAGRDDVGKRDRDHFLWNDMGNDDVPVSAGAVVSAFSTAGRQLRQYRASDGRRATDVALAGAPSSAGASVAVDVSDGQLIWLGGVTYALSAGQRTPLWSTTTVSAPTATSTNGAGIDLAGGRITVPTTTGVAVLDGGTGRASTISEISPAPGAGSLVYPLGDGFLVTSARGMAAYR